MNRDRERAEKPEHKKDNENESKDATQAGPTISTMSVIAAASAKKN
jgi:hypothetical protein